MNGHDERIRRLAALVGIAERYQDQEGRTVEAALDAQRAVLRGLGLSTETEATTDESLAQVEAQKNGLIPLLLPTRAGHPSAVPLRGIVEGSAAWRIQEESGTTREGRSVLSAGASGASIELPALPTGYHHLHIEAGGRSGRSTIIAAPSRCWEPPAMREGSRLWGTTAQIYSLRSSRNLGIGD
jgi:(1->4)-alpha-D-glucan 1-alpha-D-glucosylmutase